MDVDAELVQFVKARPLEMSFEAGTGRGELWVPSARLPSPQSGDHTAGKGGREVSDHPWPSGHNNTNTNNSSQAAAAANRTGEVSTKKGHTLHTSQGPSAGSFLSARANTNNTSNSNNSIAVTRSEEDAPTSTSFGLSILPTPIPACSELDEQPQQAAQQVAMQRQPHKGQHRSHGRACEASDAHTTAMNATQTTSNTTTHTNTTTTTTTMRGTTVTSLSAALFNAHEDDSRSPTCISASSGHLLSFTSLSDVMTHSQHSGATNTTATTSKRQRSAHRRRMAVELKRSGDVGQPHRNARPPHHAATSSNKSNSNTSGHAAQGGQSRTPRQYVARHARRTTLSSPHVVSAAAAAAAGAGAAWAKEPSVHPYSTPARLAAAPSPSAPSKGTAAQTANPVTTAATLSPVQAGYKIWQEHAQRRISISSSGGSRSDSRRPRRSAAPQLTSAYAVESAAHSPSAGLITPSQSQRERSLTTTTTTTITMSQSYTVSKAEETQPQPHVQERESLRQLREGRSTSSRSHSSHNSSSSNSNSSNSNSGGGTGAAAAARRAKEAAREGRQVVHTVPPKQRFTGLTAPPGTTTTTTNSVSDVVDSAAAVERPIVRPTTTGVVSAAAEERHAPAASRTDHDQEEDGTVSAHDTALVAVRGEEDSAAAGTAGAAQATTRRTPGESSGPQLLSVHEEVSEAMLSASPAVSSSGAYLKSATVTVSTMTSPTCANMASPALTHSLDAARLSSTPEVSALAATPTSNLTNNSNNMTFAGAAAAAIAASGNNNNGGGGGGSYLYSAQAAPMRAGPLTSEPGNVAARSPRFSPRPRYNMSSSNNANNVALPHSSEAALVVPVRDLSTPALAALLAAGDEVNELDEPIPRRLWPTHYGDHNTTEGGSTSDHAVAMMAPPPPALSPSSRVGSDAAQTGTEGEAGRSSLSLSHVNRPTARPEQNATPGSAVRTNREEEAVVVGHEEPPHRTSSAAAARASGGVAPHVSQGGAASSAARTRSRKGIAATTRTTTGNGVAASSSASSCPASRTPEAHRANDAPIIQSNDRRTGNNSSSNGHRRATALDATPSPAKPPSQTAPTIPTVHDANMSYDAAERQEAQPLLLHSSPSSAASYRETYSAFRAAVEALDRCHAEDAALELTPITPPREAQPLRALLPPPQQNIVPVSGNGRVESAPVHFAADPSSSSAQHIAAREPEDGQEDALLSERVRAVASDGVRAARESESNEEEEDEEAAEGGRRRGPWVPPLPLAQLRVPDMKPPAQPFARHEPSQSIQFSVHSDSGTQGSSCVPDGSHSSDNDRSHRYHSHSRGGAEEEEEEDNDDADSGASLSARAAMTDPLAPVPLPESNKHSRAKNNTANTNNTSNNNITSSMNNGPVMISGDTSAAMVAQMRIRDMAAAGFDGYAANRALDAGASRGASLAAGSGRQEVTIVSISSLSSSTQVMPGRNLAETGPRLSARGHLSARAADSPLGAYPNSPHTNRSNTLSARNGVREEEYPARPVVPPLRLPVLALSSSSSAAPAAAGVAPLPPTYTVVPGSDYPPSLRTSNETSAVEVGGSASAVRPGVMREATAPQAGLAGPPPAATPYRDGGNRSQRVKHSGGQCCTVM